MDLLLDLGNSALKWGWLDDTFHPGGKIAWPTLPEHVLDAIDATRPDASDTPIETIWLANVGPRPPLYALITALKSRYQAPVEQVWSEPECCGVRNGYQDFSQLGVDRWLALIGARKLRRTPNLLVVDAGTALTVDLLIKNDHQGGLITPGVELMQRCLTQNTANLARALANSPETPAEMGLGRTTRDAIVAGTHYMTAACLQTLYADLRATLPDGKLELILSGGQAQVLKPLLAIDRLVIADQLVLHGLAAVARQAKKQQMENADAS
ncbi:type III pantothenate kinase [Sulfurivirga caldicuralii]|uniref:Type III pantothenate kinase n=1 Tax=Sulfurivirga caldicuralii TaxID=364032 RepID=A0A1N6DD44_9GAMM|nr:type III pantothenate kinase [Sulfurivirga caldicuralii]SIN68637.1 type III pantothenate kinase [Sulfurivirga caldicuralii]